MKDNRFDIQFDSTDFEGMCSLMDRHKEFSPMITTLNESGETMILDIEVAKITCIVYQHNHWIRRMVYWRDGTVEELYEGKWED